MKITQDVLALSKQLQIRFHFQAVALDIVLETNSLDAWSIAHSIQVRYLEPHNV
jgi:hypothetical protein